MMPEGYAQESRSGVPVGNESVLSEVRSGGPTLIIISLIEEAISNNRPAVVRAGLSRLPLSNRNFPRLQSSALLSRFLGLCAQGNKPECAKVVIEVWENSYPSELDEISFFTQLFFERQLDVDTLQYIASVLEEYTYIEVVSQLTSYNGSTEALIYALTTVGQVFGDQPIGVYESLLEESNIQGNNVVYNFVAGQMKEITNYAPVPKWINNSSSFGSNIPTESELVIPGEIPINFGIPNPDEALELLTAGYDQLGYTLTEKDEGKERILATYSIATLEAKVNILRPVIELEAASNLQDDLILFRILGPANPLQGATLDEMKYGGNRMLIDTSFDYDEDEERTIDWFLGYCQTCVLKIRYRWYALRKPRANGGWTGCYCSFDCLRKDIAQDEIDRNILQLTTRVMVDLVEQDMLRIGIQARRPG